MDVFMTYIFQSFTWFRESASQLRFDGVSCGFLKNWILLYKFMASVVITNWLTYLVMNIVLRYWHHAKTKFFVKDFFSKCDQIHNFLRIWSHLLEKSLMKNFFLCSVSYLLLTKTFERFLLLKTTLPLLCINSAAIKIRKHF